MGSTIRGSMILKLRSSLCCIQLGTDGPITSSRSRCSSSPRIFYALADGGVHLPLDNQACCKL